MNRQQLEFLYGEIRWDEIGRQVNMPVIYGAFQRECLLKVHLLPYLLPIESERRLASELSEREFLGSLCGFRPVERKPSRSTLYSFRKFNPHAFQKTMWFLLLETALLCREYELHVSFAEWRREKPLSIEVSSDTTSFSPYPSFWKDRSVAVILTKLVSGSRESAPNPIAVQPTLPYTNLDVQPKVVVRKRTAQHARLYEAIGLPTSCCVYFLDGTLSWLTLQAPPWLSARSATRDLSFLGSSYTQQCYTVCNVIVLSADKHKVLLYERRLGFGAGTYALPGGKMQRDDKTLADCARRELYEETGLRLLESRPISDRTHKYPGKPQVRKIGVLAQAYFGQLIAVPSGWEDGPLQWYDLSNLPQPLFEPTAEIINDYLSNSFPHLQWNDIEEQLSLFDFYE